MTDLITKLSEAAGASRELLVATSKHGPKCPRCGEDGFDDWWHDPGVRKATGSLLIHLYARLKCHGCGKFFSIVLYTDGECHSTGYRALKARSAGA